MKSKKNRVSISDNRGSGEGGGNVGNTEDACGRSPTRYWTTALVIDGFCNHNTHILDSVTHLKCVRKLKRDVRIKKYSIIGSQRYYIPGVQFKG